MKITPELLRIGDSYSRADLARIFDEPNLSTSREGYYGRDGEGYIPFFVTLDKEDADPAVAYNDYFEDGLFFWESQHHNTLRSKWIKKVVEEETIPLLFVRQVAKRKGVTLPFVYAGRLKSPTPIEATSKPVKLVAKPVDLSDPLPASLVRLVGWRPEQSRFQPPTGELAQRIRAQKQKLLSGGQGLESDPRVRKAIELHAMSVARQTYQKHGYAVEDVSANRPYDLVCSKAGARPRRVEVKGTRGGPDYVSLTNGEVLAAREVNTITDLFVLHGISVAIVDGEPRASGGKPHVIQRWVPSDVDLEATQYRYRVPQA